MLFVPSERTVFVLYGGFLMPMKKKPGRWRGELWRLIEPYIDGNLRGYLGAWILEGRLWRPR